MAMRRLVVPMMVLGLVAALAGCRGRGGEQAADTPAAPEEPAGPASERSVLVLCYHEMSPGATSTYDVPSEDFAEQLQLIADEGYQSVTVDQIADYFDGKADLPERAVCFTFDDGAESILTVSKPMMDEHGFVGNIFLISDSVGGQGLLSWEQVGELAAAGWGVGSHTASHEYLTRVDAETVRAQLADSKAAIDEHTDGACSAIAYPYGLYDTIVMGLTQETGYRLAFSIDRGPADWTDDRWRVPRQMVVNGNSLKTFRNWLAQSKLHLDAVSPAIGERVATATPTITAVVTDEDVPLDGIEISRDGNPVDYRTDPDTRTITLTPELSEGANNLRLNVYGSPRREVSWVIVCDLG